MSNCFTLIIEEINKPSFCCRGEKNTNKLGKLDVVSELEQMMESI